MAWLAEYENKIAAVLPGIEFGSKPFTRFFSMPNGCYGGIVFSDIPNEIKIQSGEAILREIVKKKYSKSYIFDYYKTITEAKDFEIEKQQTTLVDISEPAWQPPDKKLRQQIHKAENEGIAPTIFDTKKHLVSLMSLVEKTGKRIGEKSKYSIEFFNALAELAEKDNRVWWFWCEYEGQPVSSNIFFLEQDNILHWQSYIDEAYSFLQPNKFIPFQAAKKAAARGIKYLNLGASPANADGVEFYKSKWGGRPYIYNSLVLKRGVGKYL